MFYGEIIRIEQFLLTLFLLPKPGECELIEPSCLSTLENTEISFTAASQAVTVKENPISTRAEVSNDENLYL